MAEDVQHEDREAMDLLGQIVSANVANLAATTNAIEKHLRRDRALAAEAFLELFHAVDRATEVVTTRDLERAMNRASAFEPFAIQFLREARDG